MLWYDFDKIAFVRGEKSIVVASSIVRNLEVYCEDFQLFESLLLFLGKLVSLLVQGPIADPFNWWVMRVQPRSNTAWVMGFLNLKIRDPASQPNPLV